MRSFEILPAMKAPNSQGNAHFLISFFLGNKPQLFEGSETSY